MTPDHDWLDALLIVRRVLNLTDIRGMVEETRVNYLDHITHRLIEVERVAGTLHIDILHKVKDLPKIERVEVMTYAACLAWWLRTYPGNPAYETPREAFQNICHRAGCWHSNTPDIRERWRLIDFETPAHLLPSACFEDRPRCKLCSQPVATGAGSQPQQVVPDNHVAFPLNGKYRADLHEECDRYIHRVMIPARQAQLDSEKQLTTATVDK